MGTYTTNLELYKPTIGEQGWGTLVNENFDKIDATSITGVIQMYAGSSAPNGWLICNGQAVSRTTYAALYAVIGTTYGAGDGSTTFNVPNLVNRTVRGSNSLGKTGGADTVTLSTANLPAHTHTGTTDNDGAHTHTISNNAAKKTTDGSNIGGWSQSSGGYYFTTSTTSSTNHKHSFTTNSTGSGSAVTIANPYVMLHYIIKT